MIEGTDHLDQTLTYRVPRTHIQRGRVGLFGRVSHAGRFNANETQILAGFRCVVSQGFGGAGDHKKATNGGSLPLRFLGANSPPL